ncbi:unnamed protein product [Paramecium pentaurelia]|uniref:Uncharacterized protein n=1 Tax=Paramecium pentaurelia TaxID=43138 RepID=A0A8S1TLM4_9CILI|nr:unnamed protein product [Paramecium pentaurelia]
MSTNQESIASFYSPKFEQQCYLCQHGLHGVEKQDHSTGIIVGEPVVVYSTPEVIVQQTVGQPIPVKRGISQSNQRNIQSTTPQRDIQQTNQIQTSPTLIQTQPLQYNQLKPFEYEKKQTYQMPIEQQVKKQAELKNSQQISTFYSGRYEEQCYLCQHGLHGKEVASTQNNVVYQTPEVIVSQNIGQPLTTRNTTNVQNFSQIINTPPRNDLVYSQQLQQSPVQNIQSNVLKNQQLTNPTLIQTQPLQYNQLKPFEYEKKQTYQMPIELQVKKQAELKNSQQISTFYSGRYEEQCYLCQHGLHGKEVASTQNNVVYQTPEVIVSQTIGQPLTTKKTTRNATTDQNFSQIINTPPRNDSVYSQQLQQSPVQNIQSNLPQNHQIISTTQQQLQQSQLQNFQLNVPQNQQLISTNQQQLQQSQFQNFQLNVPQNQQLISTTQQQLQQSPVQNFQLNVPQNQQLISTNQQPLQQSQFQNFQLNVPQNQQLISTNQQQLQQSQFQNFQLNVPQNQQLISTTQQQLQQSPVQNFQLNVPQNQQLISTNQQPLQQSQFQNFQLNVPQNQQLISTTQQQLQQSPVQNFQLNVPQNQQLISTNQQQLQQSQFQNFQLNVPQNQQLISTTQQQLQQSPVQNFQLNVPQNQQLISTNQQQLQQSQFQNFQLNVPQNQQLISTTQQQLQQSPVQNFQLNVPQNQQLISTNQQQLQQSQFQNFQLNVPQNQQLISTTQQQLQQSPVQNFQLNVPQNQQLISTNQQPLQQSQFQNFQLNVPQNQQIISTTQQQLQQSPVQNFQLNVPQNQQIISSNQQQLQQSPVQNLQLKVQQSQIIPQIIQQNQVVQQIPQVEDFQVTTVPQKVIQETLTTVQEQQITPQEQVEMYWRYKVYELQERVYELMNQISLQKQGNLQHQRTGSQIKKSTEDSFKVEQAKQEILQLESQLKLKQKTSIDLRNKLNLMIYRQDPTDEATKYKEQELQQLRQKYNTLNFKHQSNVEDIAMTQAILEAIKSGKGYKLVSVREQQQTSSYNRSSQGQQHYN